MISACVRLRSNNYAILATHIAMATRIMTVIIAVMLFTIVVTTGGIFFVVMLLFFAVPNFVFIRCFRCTFLMVTLSAVWLCN